MAEATQNSNPAQITPTAGEAVTKDPVIETKAPATDAKASSTLVTETKADPVTETKTKDPEEKLPVVPEKYDLKLPKDSLLSAKSLEEVSAYAKEKGLTNDQAQGILEREDAAVAAHVAAQKQSFKQTSETWVEAVKSDKEIGGDNFKASIESAKRLIAKFGSDDFRKTLDDTGLGNNPELVRVFARIGKEMDPDKLVIPGAQGGSEKRAPENVLYPSKK